MPKPRKTAKMTATQYMSALESLELNQVSAADFLGISVRSSHGYGNGAPIPEPTAKLLRLMVKLGLKPEDVR